MAQFDFHKDTTNRFPIQILDPDTAARGEAKTPDSTPSVSVYKNNVSVGDSVTVTAVAGKTGAYNCSHDPASEAEGDDFAYLVEAVIGGTTYPQWHRGRVLSTGAQIVDEADNNSQKLADILQDTATDLPAAISTSETNIINAVNAVNTGAARYIWIATPAGYEIPDSGSVAYPIEVRTYDGDGNPVDIDSAANPTMAVTRVTDSADLSGDLSAITKVTIGVYRMTLTVTAGASVVAPLRIDASGTIGGQSKATVSYPVITDAVAVDFTAADRSKLDDVHTQSQGGLATFLAAFPGSFPTNWHLLDVDGSGHVTIAATIPSAMAISSQVQADLSGDFAGINTNINDHDTTAQTLLDDIQTSIDNLPVGLTAADFIKYVALMMRKDSAAWSDLAAQAALINQDFGTGAGAVGSMDSQEYISDNMGGGGGGGGDGIYTLTVTVEDSGGDSIQGARVAIDGTNYSLTSDSNGQVQFNVDAGVYSLITSPPSGYDTPAAVGKTITGDDTATIVLTESVESPSDVGWIG